jgi:[ribosomal protein S5]-alanine N-acetyltransferase
MFDSNSLPITTHRLVLQSPSLDYAEQVYREFDRDITQFVYSEPNRNLEQAQDFIRAARQASIDQTALHLMILTQDTQEFVGMCGIFPLNSNTPEMGIWIKKACQKQGYGREAIAALIDWYDRQIRNRKLLYKVDRLNFPSHKIIRSLGGELIGAEQATNKSGKVLNLLVYRCLPEDRSPTK